MERTVSEKIIREATSEQLLLMAVLLGPKTKAAIDRELDHRAVGRRISHWGRPRQPYAA